MFKGGYKLIDFKDVNIPLTGTVKIEGIYEAIENSYRKPLILTGLVIENVERSDLYVSMLDGTDNEYITNEIYRDGDDIGYKLSISNDDLVKVVKI